MTLYWLRNDLRIEHNPALNFALEQGAQHAVFIVPKKTWLKHERASMQMDFILRHVKLVAGKLEALGLQFHFYEVETFAEQNNKILELSKRLNCNQVVVNEELELDERQRDHALAEQVDLVRFEADVILPKGSVTKNDGTMFQRFTPFKKAWYQQLANNGFDLDPSPVAEAFSDVEIQSDLLTGESQSWPLVDEAWHSFEDRFLQAIERYEERRNFPSISGTSKLSPYLAIGALSVKQILMAIMTLHPDRIANDDAFVNELIWRDFYRNLLHVRPNLIKGECFNQKYEDLPWPNNPDLFQAWCKGETGFPIVDAAMRQLNETGWMHNRLRMIVASFLTKDLLVDWHLGERYFKQKLIDGDFAANNGGWQWAASTGCDAQPYFRIFNPVSQSEKFDPTGNFIRKYVKELAGVPNKYIHWPHAYIKQHGAIEYASPVVDHQIARQQALEFYKVS